MSQQGEQLDLFPIVKESKTARKWKNRMARLEHHLGFSGCVIPGCNEPPTFHHIHPLGRGGSNFIENLMPICLTHHNRIQEASEAVRRMVAKER